MAGARFGGAETAFSDTCIALHEDGHRQLIVARNHSERLQKFKATGLSVRTLPFGGKLDIYTPFALDKIIDEFKPDIVQTWMARAASKLPAKKGRPYKVLSRLGGYYNLKYFKKSDYFLGNTPAISDYLKKEGVPEDRVTFFPNFAPPYDGSVVPVSRESLDTPENATVLLSLARYHNSKALDIAITAIRDIPNAYLWCAGDGPEKDALKNLAHSLGVDDRVRFLGWRDDREALLRACDICLFISRFEPFGNVFVQAWAQKTPVIVSDADGPRQFVRDGEDAIIVPRDDVTATVNAVNTLKNNRELQQKLVTNGFKRYENEFSKNSAMKAYQSLYEEMTKA